MEEITLKELLKREQMKLKDMAKKTGLSISLLSRLQTGKISLTKKTKDIFRDLFNVQIVEINQLELMKEEIENLKLKNKSLNCELDTQKTINLADINRALIIKTVLSSPIKLFEDDNTEKVLKLISEISYN